MTDQQRRERARMKRKRQVAKRKMILLLATIMFITIGSIVFGSIFTSAQSNNEISAKQYKYYKSIVIEQGDSLWSIAEEYRTDAYDDTQEYVDELKQLNALTSETIHAGQHLLVAYYDTNLR